MERHKDFRRLRINVDKTKIMALLETTVKIRTNRKRVLCGTVQSLKRNETIKCCVVDIKY